MRVYARVWPLATLESKIASGDLNKDLLFGTNGSNGLIIENISDDVNDPFGQCVKNNDKTEVILKTSTEDPTRIPGVSCPLMALLFRADQEGVSYELYTGVPCELKYGSHCAVIPTEDTSDWDSSEHSSIYALLESEGWRTTKGITGL